MCKPIPTMFFVLSRKREGREVAETVLGGGGKEEGFGSRERDCWPAGVASREGW